jgi:hypothetical protein
MKAALKVYEYVGLPVCLAELGPQLPHNIFFFIMETSCFENMGAISGYFDARRFDEYYGLVDNFVTDF